jgi:hypothetical protein
MVVLPWRRSMVYVAVREERTRAVRSLADRILRRDVARCLPRHIHRDRLQGLAADSIWEDCSTQPQQSESTGQQSAAMGPVTIAMDCSPYPALWRCLNASELGFCSG